MKPFSDCRLYTFVDMAYLDGRAPVEIARRLCDGGSDLIQLRAKTATADEIRRWGESILRITNEAGVGLVINDYPDIAAQIGAFSCHLGQEDFFERESVRPFELQSWRSRLGLGLSTHSPDQAKRALQAKPDYLAIGPIYPTATKPSAPPVTLQYVRWAAAHVTIPWFAIGGINLQNLDDVLEAGATRVCAVAAILKAPDTCRACQQFKERLLAVPAGLGPKAKHQS